MNAYMQLLFTLGLVFLEHVPSPTPHPISNESCIVLVKLNLYGIPVFQTGLAFHLLRNHHLSPTTEVLKIHMNQTSQFHVKQVNFYEKAQGSMKTNHVFQGGLNIGSF